MCQQQINLIAGQGIAEDGDFGPQSVGALKNVQAVLRVPADGWCGTADLAGVRERDQEPSRRRRLGLMDNIPLNTIANIVTAVCAVLIAIKVL